MTSCLLCSLAAIFEGLEGCLFTDCKIYIISHSGLWKIIINWTKVVYSLTSPERVQEKVQDKVQQRVQEKVQERVQDKVQESIQERVQEKVQDKV